MARSSLLLHATALLCAVVAAVVYLNTLQCGICYDDEPAIKKNRDLRPDVTSWLDLAMHDFWGANIRSTTSHKSYRPLTVATFRLNYMLHELQPLGYHLVNVLLHSAVCYLYVLLCGVVFSEVWPALIAGLLFAVHPIHTEAVAGLVGRTELLSGIFYILTFLTFRKAAISSSKAQGIFLKTCRQKICELHIFVEPTFVNASVLLNLTRSHQN